MGHQFLEESEDETLKTNGLMRTDAPRDHKSENNTFEQSEHLVLEACRITIHLQLDFYSSCTRSNTHCN